MAGRHWPNNWREILSLVNTWVKTVCGGMSPDNSLSLSSILNKTIKYIRLSPKFV